MSRSRDLQTSRIKASRSRLGQRSPHLGVQRLGLGNLGLVHTRGVLAVV